MKLKRKISHYYNAIKLLLKLKLYGKRRPVVFIFQMGKVGSRSIKESLKKQYSGIIIHGHGFSKDDYSPSIRFFYRYFQKNKPLPLKIITLVREPIGRNVSAFFQTFWRKIDGDYYPEKYTIDELKEIFIDRYKHDGSLEWMDKFKNTFDIDIYQTYFPKEGAQVYRNNSGVEVLLMRVDIPDHIKEQRIKEFLNLDKFELVKTNVGDEKVYGKDYKAFKENVKLPASYLNLMKNSKYFNHFYTPDEIDKICSKWEE